MLKTREAIADNITALRKAAKLTQAELAEKINYSDKAVSKWERGDSVPDVILLAQLAELFGVTVDYFLHKHEAEEKKPLMDVERKRLRLAIMLTACISPYIVSFVLYFLLSELYSGAPWLWKLFIFPLPAVMLLALIFNSIWHKNKVGILSFASALLWTLLLDAYLCYSSWFFFVIGIPLQLIIFFWLILAKRKTK